MTKMYLLNFLLHIQTETRLSDLCFRSFCHRITHHSFFSDVEVEFGIDNVSKYQLSL